MLAGEKCSALGASRLGRIINPQECFVDVPTIRCVRAWMSEGMDATMLAVVIHGVAPQHVPMLVVAPLHQSPHFCFVSWPQPPNPWSAAKRDTTSSCVCSDAVIPKIAACSSVVP